ncbi:protein kinase family protein [Vibrio fluminensis]|uniref:protein kinase family protein n=1 Tax=Vibrio fluminensis TaxID=2783614 RepID=UPI001889808E|nr:protein kinase family protein [Vibrio fluminensis]
MAVDNRAPDWLNDFVDTQGLEPIADRYVLKNDALGTRVKYSDRLVDSVLLQREALWLSKVALLDIDTHRCIRFEKDGNRAALVTDYISGQSLSEIIRSFKGGLSSNSRFEHLVLLLIEQVAAIHRVGIIHGDIKPSNVLMKRDGGVCLIDFSNARKVGEPWVEREVSQSTQSFMYPRHREQASQLHDYYALMMTMSLMIGDLTPCHFDSCNEWMQQLVSRCDQLNFGLNLQHQLRNIIAQLSEDIL